MGEGCRLVVDQHEATLDGTPNDLRMLADAIERPDDLVIVALTAQPTTVQRRRTSSAHLRISVDPGPSLVIEGNDDAVPTR